MIEIVNDHAGLTRCHAIRLEVFVDEQNVPLDEEVDDLDYAPSTIHLLGSINGVDLATARVLPEEPGHCHIGRVAVRKSARGTGVGREIMAADAEVARERCADADGRVEIKLSSQVQAIGFYAACGYELVPGEQYLDAGIWHRDMVLALS